MIITISGKSGSGKTYLASKLAKELDNAIHLDLDKLNSDLMKLDFVQLKAKEIFGENVLCGKQLDKNFILQEITRDKNKYIAWNNYMKQLCQEFIDKFIEKTTFSYYLLDHLNANTLTFKQFVSINCMANKDLRKERITKRENISEEELNFRDSKHIETTCDINYTQDNYIEIFDFIKNHC